MDLKRIALGVQYDGKDWQGWQTQPHGKTVQDRLQQAIKSFTQQGIVVMCAGRTDAGVHAFEQVVHLDTELDRPPISWVRGVNSFLPPSIAVRWAHPVPSDFHARSSAAARRYQYVLYNHPVRSPILHGKAGWVFQPLSLELMREASRYLLGEHDFSAFRAAECQSFTPVKTMQEITIEQYGHFFLFQFQASAFLHHMVRNIVGSLVYVGMQRHTPQWVQAILQGQDRKLAAPTFRPDGLYLSKVIYDEKWRLPQEESGGFFGW